MSESEREVPRLAFMDDSDTEEPLAIVVPPDEMLRQFEGINVAAPMVRYSKRTHARSNGRY